MRSEDRQPAKRQRSNRQRLVVATVLAVVALASVPVIKAWRYRSLDGLTGSVALALVGDGTAYGAGYSEAAFKTLQPGTSSSRALEVLGKPLRRIWWYPVSTTGPNRCCSVLLDGTSEEVLRSGFGDIPSGGNSAQVKRLRDLPAEEVWVYAGREWSAFDHGIEVDHRIRRVVLRGGRVLRTEHEVNID
jgi:hypothetical protein